MTASRLSYSDALRALYPRSEVDPGGNICVTAPYPVADDELPDLYLVQHEVGPVTLMICRPRAWDILMPLTGCGTNLDGDPIPFHTCQIHWLRDPLTMFGRIADAAAAAGLEMVIEYMPAPPPGMPPSGIDYTALRPLPRL